MNPKYLVTVRLQVKKKGLVRMLNPKILDERLIAKSITGVEMGDIIRKVRAAFEK